MSKNLHAERRERYLKRLNKAIDERSGCMNNAKWFQFFDQLQQLDIFLPEATAKFLAMEDIYKFSLHAVFEYDYCDSVYGAFHYKEIEWLSIPRITEHERFNRNEKLKSTYTETDLESIAELLDSLGKYKYDLHEDELKIYGYI